MWIPLPHDDDDDNNNNNIPAFIHALWIAEHSKRATCRICSQAKGGANVTSMLCVTDNKPGLIPYSLRKGLQLKRVQVLLYWYTVTGPPLNVTIRTMIMLTLAFWLKLISIFCVSLQGQHLRESTLPCFLFTTAPGNNHVRHARMSNSLHCVNNNHC